MTFYTRMKALADRQIVAKGYAATFRSLPTAGDPVTGLGGSAGATRTAQAVILNVDYRTFPETLARAGDLMLLVEGGGAPAVGEKWVNGAAEWEIVAVKEVNPPNGTALLWKVLVRG